MMKIIVLLLLAAWTIDLCLAEYPRYKIRGPPQPPRPPVPQYVKKWQHPPQRNPLRSRPIPVHMPTGHKIPMGMPQLANRPVAVPVRNFWKNTQNSFNNQQENIYIPKQEKPYIKKPEIQFIQKHHENPYAATKEKPFHSSPTINNHEIDYHIQTNSIPTHANTIKQVGEKGPIHTIPAPKLGPQDKPASASVEEIHTNLHYPETLVSVQKSHSYQVTEPNESIKFYKPQQHLRVQPQVSEQAEQINLYQQHQQLQVQQQTQPNVYFSIDPNAQPQSLALQAQTLASFTNQNIPQQELYLNKEQSPQLSQKELYQLISQQYPQENFESFKVAQPVAETISQTQNLYQQQLQHDNYQTLLTQLPQVYQQEPYRTVESQENKDLKAAEDKISIQPEYHSFNYEEQYDRKAEPKQDVSSSFVTAGYNLKSEDEANEPVQVTVGRNNAEAVAQAEYIQNYFQTNDDHEAENNVEPDAKPSEDQERNSEEEMQYYSTLPNKQAADSLAKLQSAGKINSNLMKLSPKDIIKGKMPMTIFVPDDNGDKNRDSGNNEGNQNVDEEGRDYDDYQDDVSQQEEIQSTFGHRIQPKNSKK